MNISHLNRKHNFIQKSYLTTSIKFKVKQRIFHWDFY